MTEQGLEAALQELFQCAEWGEDDNAWETLEQLGVDRVRTFEEAGLLTRNKGVCIRLASGESFQLTIVQSR